MCSSMTPERTVSLSFLGKKEKQETAVVYQEIANPFNGGAVAFAIFNGEHIAIKRSKVPGGAQHEAVGLRKVIAAGIPTTPLIGLAEEEDGTIVLVTSKLSGNNLFTEREPMLREELGRMVGSMHREIPVTGTIWRSSEYANTSNLLSKVTPRLESIDSTSLRQKSASLLNQLIEAVHERIPEISPSFLHGDIHNGQVLLLDNGPLALIDFEAWTEGDSVRDIAMYVFHTLRTRQPREDIEAFLKGYLTGRAFSEEEKGSLSLYALIIGIGSVSYYKVMMKNQYKYALDYLNRVVDYIQSGELGSAY